MKTISIKDFRKTRQRFTRQQYEKECGAEVSDPEVYAYTCFLYIGIHKNKEDKNEEFYYVTVGNHDHETHSLKDAERFLYDNMKSELPFKEEKVKKEKIDSVKMPNGLSSFLDTHYQIVEYMGFNQSKYKNGSLIEGCTYSNVIEELEGQAGKQEFAEDLTTKFETRIANGEFNWDETDYYYELDKFLDAAFYPKKTYVATAKTTSYSTLEIQATSQEEADRIANKLGDKFSPLDDDQNDFDIFKIQEKEEE